MIYNYYISFQLLLENTHSKQILHFLRLTSDIQQTLMLQQCPSPCTFTRSYSSAVKDPFKREKVNIMEEKGTGEEEKAAFVPYELFIQSSNELTISNSNNLSGNSSELKD